MAKRIRITIEFDSILLLRGQKPLQARCLQCGAEADTILQNEPGVVSNLLPGLRAIVAAMFDMGESSTPFRSSSAD
jgi:hypothetical protein